MRSGRTIGWIVMLMVALMLTSGCRTKQRSNAGYYKQVIRQLDEKAGRLAVENSRLRADVSEARLVIEMLKKEGGVYRGLSEDLKRKLIATLGEEKGVTISEGGLSVAGQVLFKSGHSDIRPTGKTLLKKIAAVLKDGNEVLRIDGHTDNVPIKHARKRGIKSNRHLSAMRALSVIETMKANGIASRRMFLAGFGEYWPVDSNSTVGGRQNNRRVEILVLPPRALQAPGQAVEEVPAEAAPAAAPPTTKNEAAGDEEVTAEG